MFKFEFWVNWSLILRGKKWILYYFKGKISTAAALCTHLCTNKCKPFELRFIFLLTITIVYQNAW